MRKEHIIEKSIAFPQAFKILPIVDGRPEERGTWAAYPNDESTIFWIDTSHTEAQKFYFEQLKNEEMYKMSKELTVAEDRTIKSMIAENMKAIKSILPKHITPERFARIAYTAIVSNPILARCSQLSLINAIIESSILGLEIGGSMHEASLIPFKNNKTNPATYDATLVVEYPGLIKLAKNTGDVRNISAHPVFANDQFRYNYGINQDLVHIPTTGIKGDLINAYCIIWYINGGIDFEVVGPHEAEAAKNKSATKFKKDSPWNQEENIPAMWVKTAIRRIMKRVPKAAEQRFIQVDGMSGSDMGHLKDNSGIVNITVDDLHSISIDDEKKTPQSEKKQTGKSKANQDDSAETAENKPVADQSVEASELPKEVRQAIYLAAQFPEIFAQAIQYLRIDNSISVGEYAPKTAAAVCQKISELVDSQN